MAGAVPFVDVVYACTLSLQSMWVHFLHTIFFLHLLENFICYYFARRIWKYIKANKRHRKHIKCMPLLNLWMVKHVIFTITCPICCLCTAYFTLFLDDVMAFQLAHPEIAVCAGWVWLPLGLVSPFFLSFAWFVNSSRNRCTCIINCKCDQNSYCWFRYGALFSSWPIADQFGELSTFIFLSIGLRCVN